MATQAGWIFLMVILLLIALFAVSVVVSARRQRDPNFFTENDNE
ncbi:MULTISPECIES: resistance to Congo red protein [Sporosarcina]|nr:MULTISPECIES: resistance to Congo red protein [Sporosarcina]